jgi:hypothetical protein
MHTEDEFENEGKKYGLEDDCELDEFGYPVPVHIEPISEEEYQNALQLIISQTKHPYGGFRYAQNLNIEGKLEGAIPVVCLDGLNCIDGLTGSKLGDMVAVLAMLNESSVQKLIKRLYAKKYPDLRRAFHAWGKLQERRG